MEGTKPTTPSTPAKEDSESDDEEAVTMYDRVQDLAMRRRSRLKKAKETLMMLAEKELELSSTPNLECASEDEELLAVLNEKKAELVAAVERHELRCADDQLRLVRLRKLKEDMKEYKQNVEKRNILLRMVEHPLLETLNDDCM